MSCNQGAEEPASMERNQKETESKSKRAHRGGPKFPNSQQSQAWSVLNGVRIELIQDILYYRCKNHEHGAFGK